MTCGCCGVEGILNTALGKEFYYCRECKTEIVAPPEKEAAEEIDIAYDQAYWDSLG